MSEDLGQSWEEISFDSAISTVHALANEPAGLLVGTDRGLYHYDLDTGTSSVVPLPTEGWPVHSITQRGDTTLLGGFGVVYTRVGVASNFQVSDQFAESAVLSISEHRGRTIASTLGSRMFRLGNKGWVAFRSERSTPVTYGTLSVGGRLFEATDLRGVIEDGQPTQTGLGEREVTALALFDGRIFAGTAADGVYEMTVRRRDELRLPAADSFAVAAPAVAGVQILAFPDPANDLLNVSWDDPERTPVVAYLRDESGRVVATGEMLPDQIAFDVGVVPAGLYVVTVEFASGLRRSRNVVIAH